MRIANAIVECLNDFEVKYIFGVPAGTISPLFDSLNDVSIQPIVAKNEGGAAYMAARYASVTRKMAVCFGAGGVGLNNMLNGIADAYRAKAPVLIITGYVHRWQIGKGAIQELDTQDIVKPITKYSKTVMCEEDVLIELHKAIKIANTIPMGPVHLSIPIDIQLSEIEEIPSFKMMFEQTPKNNLKKEMNQAIDVLNSVEKGILLVGKGARGFSKEIMQLSKKLGWVICTTPEGKGIIPSDFPWNYGNYGFASTDASAAYVKNPDVKALLILGSSLGENATGNFNKELFEGKTTIHIDWDKNELGKVFDTDIQICADIHEILSIFLNKVNEKNIREPENRAVNEKLEKQNTGLSLREFMLEIPAMLPKETFYLSDMGEFMNFIFKYLEIPTGGDFETNLNYAAMGSAIGGAVGVQVADLRRPVAVFAGDGDFFMNGMEILTAKEYNLPIIYFIINNAMLGFVEHGHQFLFQRVVEGFKQKRIGIADMMETCGIKTLQIVDVEQMQKIPELIKDLDGPCVIELITDGSEVAPNGDRLKALQNHN